MATAQPQNKNMTVTMGQKGGNEDAFMQPQTANDKKTPGKEGETGKASKIKDPN